VLVVLANDQTNTTNAAEAGDKEVPTNLGTGAHQGAGPSAPPPSPLRGADINTQLAQARELELKLAEEYRTVRLLRASIAGEASARGERSRELDKQARERINADFEVDNPSTPPRASQKLIAAATLLRAMPAPSTPEAQNLHREAQALSSSCSANSVTVNRGHGSGSTTTIACGGAMSIGGRRGNEAGARRDEGVRGALEQRREKRE
jgi:hypothetical protein